MGREYLARGFDVVATDPAPNAEANLRKYIDEAWKDLTNIGLSKGASRDRLTFTTDMKEALSKADFVQENGPERPDFKIKLFADMERCDSGRFTHRLEFFGNNAECYAIKMQAPGADSYRTSIQSSAHHSISGSSRRNKDIAGCDRTSARVLRGDREETVHLKKELPGHVGNRLQAALYREIMYLIQQDVLSVEDADVAVSYGPGLRWGVMGPSLQWHLGGGAGGIKHFMDHLMDPLAAMIKTLGTPDVTPELKQTIVEGVLREAGNRSVDELAQEENELLIGLLRLRAQAKDRRIEGKDERARCVKIEE